MGRWGANAGAKKQFKKCVIFGIALVGVEVVRSL